MKAKNQKDDMSKVNEHCLSCTSPNCVFLSSKEEGALKITDEEIEQKISSFLKSYRYTSSESELMYEIWKI